MATAGGGVPNLEVTNAFQSATASISGTQSPHLANASCLQCSFAVVLADDALPLDFFLHVVLFNNIVLAFSNHSRDVSHASTVELKWFSLLLSSSSLVVFIFFLFASFFHISSSLYSSMNDPSNSAGFFEFAKMLASVLSSVWHRLSLLLFCVVVVIFLVVVIVNNHG